MTFNRYEAMFSKVDAENRGAFIPFVVVGDPNIETSLLVMRALVDAGADALELGIPFSDPVADGPVIQAAVVRALESGATPPKCFDAIATIRKEYPDIPIGILTYCNPVIADGIDAYFENIAKVQIDSVLTADMPVDEAKEYIGVAAKHGVCPVFIAPPSATVETSKKIAAASKGYTYVVTRKGVTGTDDTMNTDFKTVIEGLKEFGAPRPVVGFGISKPEHVAQSIEAGAAGAISGSAVVKIMVAHMAQPEKMTRELTQFVGEMKAATKKK